MASESKFIYTDSCRSSKKLKTIQWQRFPKNQVGALVEWQQRKTWDPKAWVCFLIIFNPKRPLHSKPTMALSKGQAKVPMLFITKRTGHIQLVRRERITVTRWSKRQFKSPLNSIRVSEGSRREKRALAEGEKVNWQRRKAVQCLRELGSEAADFWHDVFRFLTIQLLIKDLSKYLTRC